MAKGFSDIKLKNTESFLEAYMEKLEMLVKVEIGRNRNRTYPSGRTFNSPLNSTGSLLESIEFKKQQTGDALTAYGLMGNDYALDINSGTPKSRVPSKAKIVDWITDSKKPIKLRNKRGKIIQKTDKSILAIAGRINDAQKIHGIAPVPFLTDAIEDSMKHMKGISYEMVEDIVLGIEQFINNLGYKLVNGKFELIKK
jgi:hypothetical protein